MNKNILTNKTFKNIAGLIVVAMFFIGDRILKVLAINQPEESVRKIIGHIFYFSFTPNYYIAFSLPLRGILLNIIIGLAIILMIFFLINSLIKKRNNWVSIGLAGVILGAVGNYYDRLKFDYVIDYLYLKYFTVFNLADVLITLGAIIILIQLYKKPSR